MQVFPTSRPPLRVLLCAVIVAVLAGCAALALRAGQPSAPAAENAPATQFSSARAMAHLMAIASVPHPVGTPANEQVRNYLLAQLEGLGFEPAVQTAQGMFTSGRRASVGIVNNILVRKAGVAPDHRERKALLLAAHYDSVAHGPGAGDDGASVAAILETLRALGHDAPLQNDLIVLLSDGEEAGLLGAEAFAAEHPWARQVGLALNFELRGNRGPMMMFETSSGNGRLIELLAAAVPHPVANSLNDEIYKLLPNDTDLSVFKRRGMASLNFAAIDGHPAYHTALDTPANLSQATLQHEGETMLALVRQAGNVPLHDLAAPDRVYFDFPGLGLLHYPAAAALPLALAAALLLVAVCALAKRRAALSLRQLGAGLLVALALPALLAAAAQLLWLGVLRLHPAYASMAQGEPYNSLWYLGAFVALSVAAFVALAARLQPRIDALAQTLGAAWLWLALLGAAVVLLPGVTFLLTWPLLATLLACLALVLRPGANSWQRAGLLLAGAAPGVLLCAPLVHAVFIGLGPSLVAAMVALLALQLGLMAALLVPVARVLAALALVAGLACLGAGTATAGFDAAHPRQTALFYLKDGQSGKALWISTDPVQNRWTRLFFPGVAGPAPLPAVFGPDGPPVWSAPAPEFGLTLPAINVLADQRDGAVRRLVVDIKSPRGAPQLTVTLEGCAVLRASLHGRALTRSPRANWALGVHAIGEDGVRLSLEVEAGKPFLLRVRERSFGLPPGTPARPDDMIAQPFGSADSMQSVSVRQFKEAPAAR